MANNISKDFRVVGLISWKSPVLTISFVLLSIFFLIDSVLNGEGMGDVVLCIGPLFSGLKEKMTKGLNKLNSLIEDEGDESDDFVDKLAERFEKNIERKFEEREKKQRDKEVEREKREREKEEEEKRKEREEEEREKREERRREYEEMVRAKYERGEELTAKEQFTLSLLMECDEAQADKKRILAEEEERKRREAAEKKEKRKELLSKVGKAVAGVAGIGSSSSNSSATNNSQTNTSTKKTVRKVWTMKYIGQGRSDGPKFLQVPSENIYGRPTGNEIKEALLSLGYDNASAHSLANGGGESTWEVVG